MTVLVDRGFASSAGVSQSGPRSCYAVDQYRKGASRSWPQDNISFMLGGERGNAIVR